MASIVKNLGTPRLNSYQTLLVGESLLRRRTLLCRDSGRGWGAHPNETVGLTEGKRYQVVDAADGNVLVVDDLGAEVWRSLSRFAVPPSDLAGTVVGFVEPSQLAAMTAKSQPEVE